MTSNPERSLSASSPAPLLSLTLAGFSEEEQAIYLTVLDAGHADPDEIAAHLDMSPAAVRTHVSELQRRGFVVPHAGDPTRLAAVDPRSFLTAAADALVDEARVIRGTISKLVERFDRARAQGDAGAATSSRVTEDPAVVAAWYAQLQHAAVREVRVFDRPPYISVPMPDLETTSLTKGVAHRAIYTLESFSHAGAWEALEAAQAAGEISRVVSSLPLKMVIADDDAAVVCLSVDPGAGTALFTSSGPLIAALGELFETYWDRGVALHGRATQEGLESLPAERATGLDASSQAILSLIGAGATDERIAERLGISVRSVRRRTSALMADVGAGNRFQFGAIAARRGWI